MMHPGDIVTHKLTEEQYIYLGAVQGPDERKFGVKVIVRDKAGEERSFYQFELKEA